MSEARLCSDAKREALSSQPDSLSQTVRETFSSQPPTPTHVRKEVLSTQPASPTRSSTVQHESNRASPEAEGDSGGEEEDSGTPISWPPSPSAHLRAPCQPEDLDRPTSPPSRRPSEQQDVPAAGKARSRAAALPDFSPSSSVASETGLEVEVPRAITDVLEPIDQKTVAVIEPTPPSAQIISCTLTEKTSPVQMPEMKHRRRMISPTAAFASPGPAERSHPPRLAVLETRTAPLPRSSSPVVSSSSPVARSPPRYPTKPSSAIPPMVGEHSLVLANQPGIHTATPQLASNQGSSNSAERLPPNGPPSQVPFTAFKVVYPDFEGSLNDFIRGVMCLAKLQEDRALADFLYDDFVRVFSQDYLAYIDSLDPGQRALPAIKWYNENVRRPVYVKGFLTRDNLKDVLSRYPEEVRAIQQGLEAAKTSRGRRPTRRTPDTAKELELMDYPPPPDPRIHVLPQNGHPIAFTSASFGRQDELLPDRRSVAAQRPVMPRGRGTIGPPASTIDTSGRSQAPGSRPKVDISSETRTPSRLEALRALGSSWRDNSCKPSPQATRTQLPGASTLADIAPSQLSNPDSIPEMSRKRKAAPGGSTTSSGAEPGAEFKRIKGTKTGNKAFDVQGFKKWFDQEMPSSAPQGSSAP
jgi:hypothetical protein